MTKKRLPPEIIEKIRKKEEEKFKEVQIPLYLPEQPPEKNKSKDKERSPRVYTIDM